MKVFIISIVLFLSPHLFAKEVGPDISKVLKEVKLATKMVQGKFVGFKTLEVKKGSKFEKLGFKNGDVIKSINGVEIKSPAQAMRLYSELKSGDVLVKEKSK